MAFVIRKFDHTESLGKKLKAIRASAGYTLNQMARKTKIRKTLLQAFENGDYTKLPDPMYARNFLKVYVRNLGGDETYFLKQFEAECGTCEFSKHARLPRARARALDFLVASRFLKVLMIVLVGLGIGTYLGLQVRAILLPPQLVVFTPTDGLFTQDASVLVKGKGQEGANVKVNGTDVLLATDGTFETRVALERGLNIISIESTKRYSKSVTEYRRVVLSEDQSLSLAP